ncbi:unnamed protein product [Dicrocoelium dendriticum]|nr:unnamed protein product [Dicrocoelium dendriticum]
MRIKCTAIHDSNVERLQSWRKGLKDQEKQYEDLLLKGGQLAASITPRDAPPEKPSESQVSYLCNKIAECVQQHWDAIQQAFIDADVSGASHVLCTTFMEIARRFNFPLTDRELTEICLHFTSREKDYLNYLKFMKHFAKIIPGENLLPTKYDERTYKFTNLKNGETLTFADVHRALLKVCKGKWRTLKEAFKKLDSRHQGILTLEQIDDILKKQDIQLSEGDLYHLYSSFDSKMHGYIDFNEFKRTLLKTYKPVV